MVNLHNQLIKIHIKLAVNISVSLIKDEKIESNYFFDAKFCGFVKPTDERYELADYNELNYLLLVGKSSIRLLS